MIERILLTASHPCPFGCLYCFAVRNDYRAPQAEVPLIERHGGLTILYPTCDGEFFLLPDFHRRVMQLDESITTETVVSISTKAPVKPERLDVLASLDRRLRATRRGFVKTAVSFATSAHCDVIEPGAASFRERIKTLEAFTSHGLESSVTIKPLLPFVDEAEYFQIVRDCSPYTSAFLLGDLYVTDDEFFRSAIADRYPVTTRTVSWLSEHPVWAVVESVRLKTAVRQYIHTRGLQAFDSDAELIAEKQGSLVRA